MRINKIIRSLALLLILVGLLVMAPIGYYNWHNSLAVSATSLTPVKKAVLPDASTLITGDPNFISIPSLNINLPVVDGFYNASNGQWNLSLDKAQYATPSVQPNNLQGNTLIYGHYRPEVFAYLHLIKPGAQVTLETSNGYVFSYTYTGSQAYDPSDTSIFDNTGAPRLSIQTCSGAYMQNRQMYSFTYNGYTKL